MQFRYLGKNVSLKGFSETDWIYSIIKRTHNFYEIDLLKYVRFVMRQRPKGCILDVGANIGNHSVFFGLYVAEKVVSFEPNPDLFPILQDNLKKNLVDYEIYRTGLGANAKKALLEIPEAHADNIGAAKLMEVQEGERSDSHTISVVTLDSLLEGIESFASGLEIVALKIDVEGMESDVLKGGQRLLTKYKPELFVEIADSQQMEKVKSVIYPLGYKPIVDWAATPVWHFVNDDYLGLLRKMKLHTYILFHKKIGVFVPIIIRQPIKKIIEAVLRLFTRRSGL